MKKSSAKTKSSQAETLFPLKEQQEIEVRELLSVLKFIVLDNFFGVTILRLPVVCLLSSHNKITLHLLLHARIVSTNQRIV